MLYFAVQPVFVGGIEYAGNRRVTISGQFILLGLIIGDEPGI
jgi:hypothetical protein